MVHWTFAPAPSRSLQIGGAPVRRCELVLSIYNEELVWLKDLYISRGYPPATVIQWIKSSKEIAFKNRLDWVVSHSKAGESERIWPLKSVMNPVWQKLNLRMVSESMRSVADTICEEERARIRSERP
jgi:hypothetical protein